ncbi:MAG: hypothetical protein J1E31_04415 [Helicobacter sp.]|nr:hypothetical protein [Helicobacter sp.]
MVDTVSGFVTILSIMGIISVVVVLATIISVAKSGDRLTGFEKKTLISVALILCLGIILLFILSHLELFKAVF